MLEKEGIVSEVINTRFLKPFDKESAIKSIEKTKNVINYRRWNNYKWIINNQLKN